MKERVHCAIYLSVKCNDTIWCADEGKCIEIIMPFLTPSSSHQSASQQIFIFTQQSL